MNVKNMRRIIAMAIIKEKRKLAKAERMKNARAKR